MCVCTRLFLSCSALTYRHASAVNTPRWDGVDFVVTAAKAVARREAFVRVTFRAGTLAPTSNPQAHELLFQIQGGQRLGTVITAGAQLPKPVWPDGWEDASGRFWDGASLDTPAQQHATDSDFFKQRLPQWWVGAPATSAPPAYHALMQSGTRNTRCAGKNYRELAQISIAAFLTSMVGRSVIR